MEKLFADKVAIVTGASSGLGRDIAEMYARNGANVVVAARRAGPLNDLVTSMTRQYGGKHLAVPTNLADVESIKNLFKATLAEYSSFDIVVNNAGDAKLWPLTSYSDAEIKQHLDVMVYGFTLMHKYALQHFQERKTHGQIIDILSSSGVKIFPANGVYGGAKHYQRTLSLDNQKDNADPEESIAFIRLYPSNIDTPLINETKAHPDVWNYIKGAPKLNAASIAAVVERLSKEGKSTDVYMEQLKTGLYIARFTVETPEMQPDPELISYASRSK